MFERLKCFFGYHDYECVEMKPTGYATLGWHLRADREYAKRMRCSRCRQTKVESGFLVFGDYKLHPEAYDESGWPLNEDGTRMKVKGP